MFGMKRNQSGGCYCLCISNSFNFLNRKSVLSLVERLIFFNFDTIIYHSNLIFEAYYTFKNILISLNEPIFFFCVCYLDLFY